ncbi:MAG: PD-(D/E)XK nuclease family protein [Solidesulfovibrio sp.]|uniref:PD-(D/E)XK nuclease family protein n=1 Tax=Solidesulfovibrio sp. TaxID=2910990 RepID=UPI003157F2AD
MKPVGIIPWTEEFFGAVAKRLVAATGGDFTDVLVIFPLRRAARHLCDRLAALPELPKPLLAPEIVAVGDWAAAIGASFAPTPPAMLDVLDRVAILHDIVRDIAADTPVPGDFPTDMARFFPWGLELAERMEELFRHNVPGRDLAHLQGQVLAPAAALLSRLGAIHDRYRQRLVAEGLATPGLCLTLAAENAREAAARFAGKKIFACGFAVPSGAEKALFAALWRQGDLEMLWHGDPALADPGGRVHFSCLEQKRWLGDLSARAVIIADGRTRRARPKAAPDRPTLVLDADTANLSSKKLRFFEGHDLHAQLKALETCLDDAPDLEDTAIVLPDTGLLSPVLHILPRKDVNISMGYPLARSSLARLLEIILTLQETALSPGRYHWKGLVSLVRHPYLKMLRVGDEEPLRGVFHAMEAALRRGGAFVDPFQLEAGEEDVPPPPEVAALAERVLTTCLAGFADVETPRALGNAVAGLCGLLLDPDHAGDAWERFLIDAECLFRLATAVVPTLTGGRLADAVLPRDTLFSLLRRLVADERAPFEAEPLTGLQVLGVLETRLLTFRRVYVLDAVEDKLPGSAPYEPLLPDPLRRLLSLPDARQRDLVAAYNIYRLFFGAEEITLLYRTGAPGAGLFEDAKPSRSRYVEQLLWEEEKRRGRVLTAGEPPVSLVRLPLCPIPEADAAMPVTPAVAARLDAYLQANRLSATFLDTYLACPLRFFYRYLSPLAALAEVAEEGDPAAVGIAAHEALREFFTPYLGRDIDAADIDALALADLFEARLAGNPAYQALPPDGRLLLARAGRHRLSAMAAALPRTTPFALETELAASLEVSGRTYLLAGRADRLDRREEGVVIVDYKTGSVPAAPASSWTDEAFFRSVAEFRDAATDPGLLAEAANRFPSVQLPLYCWLYGAGRGERPADAVFVELREDGQEKPLFGPRFEPAARREIIERRLPQLLRFLLRHLTTAASFAPRPEARRCPYCDFRPACGAAAR